MSKNILVIVSTPRKNGNSEILSDRFIEGAKEAGYKTVKVCLRELKIGYCMACGYCLSSGGICVQKDDMSKILDEMHKSDVIVFSTPVYKSCMCAQLKTVIDRMFAGNATLIDKDFYFIATAADSDEAITSTMESMRGATYALKNAKIKGEIYGGNACNAGDIMNSSAMQEAYEKGKNC